MEGKLPDDWGNSLTGHRRERESAKRHVVDRGLAFTGKSHLWRGKLGLLSQISSDSRYLEGLAGRCHIDSSVAVSGSCHVSQDLRMEEKNALSKAIASRFMKVTLREIQCRQ